MTAERLLVVEDETDVAELVTDVARGVDYEVAVARDRRAIVDSVAAFAPSVIVLDLMMPDIDGVEVLRLLAQHRCPAKVLLMSGSDSRVLHSARQLGARHGLDMAGTLRKPIDVAALEAALTAAKSGRRAITESDLERGIARGELVVHYQPKVELGRKDLAPIDAFEALVRWQHAERGLLPPAAFVPLAESSGLIGPVTDAVLDSVIAQMAAWQRRGFNAKVAVNVAAQLLADLAFPDRLGDRLAAADVAPAHLALEITETGLMADIAAAMDILTRLRLKGVRLSMDDFGTGYSSLVQLFRMPISELKIDRSFVVDLAADDEAKVIVRSIVDLARSLGLEACAEGVEDAAALDLLRDYGAHAAQGFIISKPLPVAELDAFCAAWPEPAGARD